MKLYRFIIMFVLSTIVGKTFADNLSVEDVSMKAGETKEIAIVLNNPSAQYVAFQFDLILPDGISIAKDKKNKLIVSLNEDRIDDHTMTVQLMESNTYRFISYSMTNAEFYETDGDLLYVTLQADNTVKEGALTAIVKEQVFTDTNENPMTWSDFSFNIVIEPAIVPEITADNKTRVYGDKNPAFTYTTSAKVVGEPILTTTAIATSPIGEYDITVERGTVTNEYTAVNGKLSITKAPLTITAKSYTIKQGEALPIIAATYSGFKNNETESVLTKKPTFACAVPLDMTPGTYDITASGAEAQNYEISYVKGTLIIEKADEPEPPTPVDADNLSVEDVSMKAGETKEIAIVLNNPSAQYVAFQFDLILPDGISIAKDKKNKLIVSLNEDRIDDHTMTVQLMESNTYRFISYSMTNAEFYETDGDLLYVTLQADNTVKEGALTAIVKEQVFTDTNENPMTWSDFSFNIVIEPAIVPEITADNKTRVYGDKNPAFTYTTSAKVVGEPILTTTAIATSPIGEYDITVERGTVTNEYTAVNGKLSITKAPLTITAKSYTIKQGEALPIIAATYSGFKNNETESVLTKKPTFACAVPLDMTPGTYDITASGAEAQNYEISYVKGTLTIEKKDEPEPITRNPFNGKIRLPGTLEAENFDRGGEGITYHDNDPGNNGGTNYRSGNDTGVDIVTGNGGYAVGWTNGGEWIEYTMNVTKAGKYTYEAIISNGTGDNGGFSISLVGNDGKLTKLADVSVPSTAGNWENYQPVEGELLQNLEVGSQIFRITITAGNCNIDKIKFELKKDEPAPAYRVGDDITSLATAEWEGKTGDYGGLANPSVERYTNGTPEDTGDILTQTISGLRNGTYRVKLEVAASFTPERGFDCPTGDGLSVAFANSTQRNLSVVERGWVGEGEQKLVTLTTTVTDGTLKYGIKNLAKSGNWFVARVNSIVYVSESNQTPKTYAIRIVSENNGKTTTDVTADEEGSRVFVTATPNEGCTLESIKVATTGGQEVEVTNNSFIMPASAVKVTATYKAPVSDAIEDVVADDDTYQIYTIDGKPVEALQQGVNIIKYQNGTTKKVLVK